MMQRMSTSPLMDLVVLIDIAGLGARDTIERCDSRSTQSGQRSEYSALFFGNLSPFELIHHSIALAYAIFGELLRSVFAAERLEISIWHRCVNINTLCLDRCGFLTIYIWLFQRLQCNLWLGGRTHPTRRGSWLDISVWIQTCNLGAQFFDLRLHFIKACLVHLSRFACLFHILQIIFELHQSCIDILITSFLCKLLSQYVELME
mmetsp:Transcript_93795/g.146477  ORF Transcript_93795/g.146477 Transcript_93795/m.146477 type:complete len:205 (+) Transcript_93795:123-737(+)